MRHIDNVMVKKDFSLFQYLQRGVPQGSILDPLYAMCIILLLF